MQGTFIGFNTASIKYEDKFLALMLKVKLSNQLCQSYYLQAQALTDLLLVLQHRMAVVLQRLNAEGESYKSELVAFNEQLIENTPVIDMPEVQQPNPERRVISITLKQERPGQRSFWCCKTSKLLRCALMICRLKRC